MKKIHIKKPDIKGAIDKLKNLKKEDVIATLRHERSGVRELLKRAATVHLQGKCSLFINL